MQVSTFVLPATCCKALYTIGGCSWRGELASAELATFFRLRRLTATKLRLLGNKTTLPVRGHTAQPGREKTSNVQSRIDDHWNLFVVVEVIFQNFELLRAVQIFFPFYRNDTILDFIFEITLISDLSNARQLQISRDECPFILYDFHSHSVDIDRHKGRQKFKIVQSFAKVGKQASVLSRRCDQNVGQHSRDSQWFR